MSGPNLNETSIVSGGYGGPAGGIIPTSAIKGKVCKLDFYWDFCKIRTHSLGYKDVTNTKVH